MAFQHGTKARLSVNAVDYSCYVSETGPDLEIGSAQVTVLCNTAENYIPGIKDGTIPMSGKFDPTIDAAVNTAIGVGIVPFQWDPQGATSGLPRYTGNCFFTSYSMKAATDDAGTFEAEVQITNGWTRALVP